MIEIVVYFGIAMGFHESGWGFWRSFGWPTAIGHIIARTAGKGGVTWAAKRLSPRPSRQKPLPTDGASAQPLCAMPAGQANCATSASEVSTVFPPLSFRR